MLKHIYTEPQFGEDWFTYPNLYKSMVNLFPTGAHFVEVGSWKGKSSAFMITEILNSNKKIKFDCVDTFEGGPEHNNIDTSNLYDIFISNMKPFENNYNVLKMTSVEASKQYEDNSLDFVFIDACHDYECVNEDIKVWYPKVKIGGILAGHDYPAFPGVVRAVHEHINENLYFTEMCWIHNKIK
jgi:hypothetical protein